MKTVRVKSAFLEKSAFHAAPAIEKPTIHEREETMGSLLHYMCARDWS